MRLTLNRHRMKSRKTFQVVVHGSQGEQLIQALNGFPGKKASSIQFTYNDNKNNSEAHFTVMTSAEFKTVSQATQQDSPIINLLCPATNAEVEQHDLAQLLKPKPIVVITNSTTPREKIESDFTTPLLAESFKDHCLTRPPQDSGQFIVDFFGQLNCHYENTSENKLRLLTFAHASVETKGAAKHAEKSQPNAAHQHFFKNPIYDKKMLSLIYDFMTELSPDKKAGPLPDTLKKR
jgi:hypothetical protein